MFELRLNVFICWDLRMFLCYCDCGLLSLQRAFVELSLSIKRLVLLGLGSVFAWPGFRLLLSFPGFAYCFHSSQYVQSCVV